jgi:hypothetical protein
VNKIEQAVEAAKEEILEDISNGIVPVNVRSFETLHDYVDANEYLMNLDDRGMEWDDWIEEANQVTAKLDVWLRDGMPA